MPDQEERQAMAEKLLNLSGWFRARKTPLPYEPHDWNSPVSFLCGNNKLVDISQAWGQEGGWLGQKEVGWGRRRLVGGRRRLVGAGRRLVGGRRRVGAEGG